MLCPEGCLSSSFLSWASAIQNHSQYGGARPLCGRSPVKSCPAEGPFEGPLNMARGTGKGFRRSLEWVAPNRKFLARDRFENAKSLAIWRPNDRFRPNGSQSPISLQPTL